MNSFLTFVIHMNNFSYATVEKSSSITLNLFPHLLGYGRHIMYNLAAYQAYIFCKMYSVVTVLYCISMYALEIYYTLIFLVFYLQNNLYNVGLTRVHFQSPAFIRKSRFTRTLLLPALCCFQKRIFFSLSQLNNRQATWPPLNI